MKILNYKWYSFSVIEEENFFVAYFNYIDYNKRTKEVCITRQYVWREELYVAKFSGFTTEYIWSLTEVLDKVIKEYKNNETKM